MRENLLQSAVLLPIVRSLHFGRPYGASDFIACPSQDCVLARYAGLDFIPGYYPSLPTGGFAAARRQIAGFTQTLKRVLKKANFCPMDASNFPSGAKAVRFCCVVRRG